jgi:amino acid transporter
VRDRLGPSQLLMKNHNPDPHEPDREQDAPRDDGGDGKPPGEINLDLTRQEMHQGSRAGDKYVRVVRPYGHLFRRVAPGHLRATEVVQEPKTALGRISSRARHLLIGPPLPTHAEIHERLTKIKALAIFASDAMSSVAYATEEILFVLLAAGSGALGLSVGISFAIALLLSIVAFSYRQTVLAYPNGGGSYIVSKDNLGVLPGLVAASALMLDYILTVAVSISAGTAAITSAFQFLLPYTVPIALIFVGIMVVGNLRGIRESGNIFAAPTYVFIISIAFLIFVGLFRILFGLPPVEDVRMAPSVGTESVTLWLVLTAFSAGSVAMSGTEAISNGVPAFKPPESKNAATTLTVMATILGFFFLGVSFLAWQYGIAPNPDETVVSQLGRAVFGKNYVYYLIQFATMAILVLAANTSFADFPRLSSILARDGFMPRQFAFRGDRLAFSYGIVALGLVAAALIMAFEADTHLLIPLYAVGVFLAFTLSQSGMVLHWRRLRTKGWRRSAVVNGIGAAVSGVVLLIAAVTKFERGAWIIVLLIPILVLVFSKIHQHYQEAEAELQLIVNGNGHKLETPRQIVVVPLADFNLASARALEFAHSISKQVNAVHVADSEKDAEQLKDKLSRFDPDVRLIVLESPYRTFFDLLLAYIDAVHEQDRDAFITVVVPEIVTAHWWQRFLHNGTADRLNRELKPHPNVAVVNVPYVLGH